MDGALPGEGQQQQQQDGQQMDAELVRQLPELQRLSQLGTITSWPECLTALNLYVIFYDRMRHGTGSRLPENIGEYIDGIHNNILSYVNGNGGYVGDVLRAIFADADMEAPGEFADSESTRSRRGNDDSSDHTSSGRDWSSGGGGGSDGLPGASSGSHELSASTVAHASATVNSFETTRSSGETRRQHPGSGSSDYSIASSSSGTVKLTERPPLGMDERAAGLVTTLAVYHVPDTCTQDQLTKEWPLDGSYNFLYLRNSNARRGRNHIAIVNFTTAAHAAAFKESWNGEFLSTGKSSKPLAIVASSVQGRDPNLMLVMDSAPTAPVVLIGNERLGEQEVRGMVKLAKCGLLRTTI